jgi:hypothetical protein
MQRFNKELTIKDLEDIVRGIKSGKHKFLYRQSLTRSIFEGDIKGEIVRFVYDRKRHVIITFLPNRRDCK